MQLVARNGKLVAEDATGRLPRGDFLWATASEQVPCERARLWPAIDYFIPENAPSRELLLKAGFRLEGEARAYLKINGVWRDHLLFGMLAGDILPRG